MRNLLRFLDNDSPFGRVCTFLGTLIVANLMFVVTLLPVVTAGAGFCALYYSMLKLVRYKEINPFEEFWRGLKDNFRQATLAWLAILLLGAFLVLDMRICSWMTGVLHSCVFVVYAVGIILALIAMYIFPVMASFEGRLRDNLKNSIYFIGKNLLFAAVIAFLNVMPLLMTYLYVDYLPLAAFLWCICGFSVIALCNSRLLMHLFRKHLEPLEEEQEAADRKKILEEMKKLEG